MDLIQFLSNQVKENKLVIRGKNVLELGCGHGLPGIFCILHGAKSVYFQDFNEDVLKKLTIPNVVSNMQQTNLGSAFSPLMEEIGGKKESSKSDVWNNKLQTNQRNIISMHGKRRRNDFDGETHKEISGSEKTKVKFFAGDWSRMDSLLFPPQENPTTMDQEPKGVENSNSESGPPIFSNTSKSISQEPKTEKLDVEGSESSHEEGFDIILTSETIYSPSSISKLLNLMTKCLRKGNGTVYLAAKKFYFGVGGGTRQFCALLQKQGILTPELVAEIADGASNVREIWKLRLKRV